MRQDRCPPWSVPCSSGSDVPAPRQSRRCARPWSAGTCVLRRFQYASHDRSPGRGSAKRSRSDSTMARSNERIPMLDWNFAGVNLRIDHPQKGSSIRRTVEKSLDGTSQLRLLRASYEGLKRRRGGESCHHDGQRRGKSTMLATISNPPGSSGSVQKGLPPARPPATRQAAALTSIFLASGWATAGFGTVTVSTPFAMLALMCSGLTPSGSSRDRENEP